MVLRWHREKYQLHFFKIIVMVTQNVFGGGFSETLCTYIDNNKITKLVIFYLIILTYINLYSWISINILLHLLKKFEEIYGKHNIQI